MRCSTFFIILLGLLSTLFSIAAEARKYAHQLQRLSPDEGLSQGYVSDILQDELGYIWIGTGQGLNRFDGYQVKTIPAFDQFSINLIYETNNNKLLISTEYSGAYMVDPITLKVDQIYSGKLNKEDAIYSPISAVLQHNEIFYFAINQHVYTYTESTKNLNKEFSIEKSDHIVRALTIDDNYLYIGTSNGLYSKSLTDDYTTNIPLLPPGQQNFDNTNVKYLHLDKQLGLMVGTVEGLYSIPINQTKKLEIDRVKTLIAEHNIWHHIVSDYGEFFVTESGLYQYDRNTGEKEFILNFEQSKFNITDNTITKLIIDNSGLMWMSSRSQGVFTWSTLAKRFTNIEITHNGKLHSNLVLSVFADTHNDLWLGTENGLTKYNPVTANKETFLASEDKKAFFGEHSVYGITSAELGEPSRYLWLLLYHGLALFDKQNQQLVPITQDEKSPEALNKADSYGYHLIAPDTFAFLNNDNFYIYNGKTGQTRIINGLADKLDLLTIHTFLKPLSNYPNELVISAAGALYRYNEATQKLTTIYKVKNHNPLMYMVINDWVIDYNNTLWLASSHEGLIALDATTYKEKQRINFAQGINTKSVFALQIDQFGFLWASSQNGLYKIDLNSLQVTSFTVKDGLTVNEFNHDAHAVLDDGRLAFGSTQGLLTLAPQDFLDIPALNKPAQTQITNISLLSKDLSFHPNKYNNERLQLDANDMGLEVSFSNFDFLNIDKTRYKITLSGPNSFTYNNYKNNKVFLPTLTPGEYELAIASYSNYQDQLNQPATLRFVVAYVPWRSPLAMFSYAMIIFAIVLFIVWQYRTKRNTIEQSHQKVLQSQQQTDLALTSSNSGVWEINVKAQTGTQNRLAQELGYPFTEEVSFNEFYKIIHPDDAKPLSKRWENYLLQSNDEQWQATYRIQHIDGHWLWYQDIGKVTQWDESGAPVKVSGIYTNITKQRANAQQAAILGEAFGQITDWLLILDNSYQPLSVNNSFADAFSIDSDTDKLNIKRFLSALGKRQYIDFITIIKTLKAKQNWRGEAYIKSKTNPSHPIHVSITAVAKTPHVISYYVIVISDLTEQKRAENELRYLANYDTLTKLPNRSFMYQRINKVLKTAESERSLVALLFIDLDKFKPVNDSFGHAVGDQLLCNITQRVNDMLDENSILGRQSGDEFLLLTKNIESPQALSALVQSVSAELGKRVVIDDFAINISASIGVALYPFDADSADTLIRHADIAMMHAKQAGRNGFKFFTEQMNEKITQKLLLENALKDAYKDDLLFNHYQPIVNRIKKKINGVELLLRWKHQGSLVSPAIFIPIAEEAGLIELLTEQALSRALAELATLFRANPRFYLSLNLSPVHILKFNLSERLLHILAKHNVQPNQLRLEITENTLLEDKDKAAKQLQMLKSAGFKLLLDDFGTGYSSLTYLSRFPIDVIKIDQSFVRNIGVDSSNESIIKTIFLLAENLNLFCIAEGVENIEQIEFLMQLGCNDFQGYYFAKPMPSTMLLNEAELNPVIEKLQSI